MGQLFLGTPSGPTLRLPNKVVGQGGEATVYTIGNGLVAKMFKDPDDPDVAAFPEQQAVARERLNVMQQKLPALINLAPRLPTQLVLPRDLIVNRQGQVRGYTMTFLAKSEVLYRYSERSFRQQGISFDTVRAVLASFHRGLGACHASSLVFGDLNDLNIMVQGEDAYLIDTDAIQFDRWLCSAFTAKFVDPTLCQLQGHNPVLVKPYGPDADWYAYAVILMKCLLYVDPYGGLYRPQGKKGLISQTTRPMQRITIFHPDVVYPKPAIHYSRLPDDLVHEFQQRFIKDRRGIFPLRLVEGLRFTTCSNCGAEHARSSCPNCQQASPAAIKQRVTVTGQLTATQHFRTSGVILEATSQGGKLGYLYHEAGGYRREGGEPILRGPLDATLRFRIFGPQTMVGRENDLVLLEGQRVVRKHGVNTFGNVPMFDTNSAHQFWLQGGNLFRNGQIRPEQIGTVVEDQTQFWVGSKLGFGFTQAGKLQLAFIFRPDRTGVNDNLKLPRITGQIVSTVCYCGDDRVWFFVASQDGPNMMHRCFVISQNGDVLAMAEAMADDGSWLGALSGKIAVQQFLLAATDDGLLRLEIDHGSIAVAQEFAGTEAFVSSESRLTFSQVGLEVVGANTITTLTFKP